jgi:glycosyltransferase
VGFLNGDDFYTNKAIVRHIAHAFERHDTDCVYGDLYYVNRKNTQRIIRSWRSGKYNRKKFRFGWMPPHPTFFAKRELFERRGGFDLEFKSAADYELMLRFLFRYRAKCHYLPEFFVKMRAGGTSNRSFQNRVRANQEDRRAWEKNCLKPLRYTLYMKPVRKIPQFLSIIRPQKKTLLPG